MNLSHIATSQDAKENGRPFPFGDGKIVLAANGNTKHLQALRRLTEPHLRTLAHGGQIPDAINKAIDDEAFAEAVIVGWEGMEREEDGKLVPLPYSKENALWALRSSDVFRNFVMRAAEDRMLFTVGAVAAATETLKKS